MVVDRCVACNKLIPIQDRDNHKCSKRCEAGRLSAQRRFSGLVPYKPTYGQRLAEGFQLMGYNEGNNK